MWDTFTVLSSFQTGLTWVVTFGPHCQLLHSLPCLSRKKTPSGRSASALTQFLRVREDVLGRKCLLPDIPRQGNVPSESLCRLCPGECSVRHL